MYVQAAKASSSNGIVIEKDLWNSENGRTGISKVRNREKCRKKDLRMNDEPDVNMASSRLGKNVGCC